MAFKNNDDFARMLTQGAYATAAVSDNLERRGHRIIELERYAKANKIWSTKVKRLRLADLLCIRCGRRFESKGKSKLEFKLSDSNKPTREWWAAMRKDDVFAFVQIELTPSGPDIGQVAYVTRQALHDAEGSMRRGGRKAVADGAEANVSWPITVSKQGGQVAEVGADRIRVQWDSGRHYTYAVRGWAAYHPLREVGERFVPGSMLASSVELAHVDCGGDVWDWKKDLQSLDDGDRFPAVKAARFLGPEIASSALHAILGDADNDWRLRLEAAASLAPIDSYAVDYMVDRALDASASEGEPMEAVFALSEINSDAAVQALLTIADAVGQAPPEVRAAAVWGLGLGARPSPELLVPRLGDSDDLVALHAASAMPVSLPSNVVASLLEVVESGDLRPATSAAHVLSGRGHASDLLRLVPKLTEDIQRIVILAIGDAPAGDLAGVIDEVDAGLAATVCTLQAQRSDWLRAPENLGGVEVLMQQRVRL